VEGIKSTAAKRYNLRIRGISGRNTGKWAGRGKDYSLAGCGLQGATRDFCHGPNRRDREGPVRDQAYQPR
jgi:hypothetical protein